MTTFTLDKEKYKAAFLYLTSALGKIEGKKKACKLFYFLDFDFFEAYEKPFTGDIYKAFPMGPMPIYLNGIIEELKDEGKIKLRKIRTSPTHDNDTVIYEPAEATDYKFSNEEKKMLDRIVHVYGNLTGKDLEELSHSQAPYNAVGIFDVIPYEFTYYRDTPNLVD